jgi:hypothetical protein
LAACATPATAVKASDAHNNAMNLNFMLISPVGFNRPSAHDRVVANTSDWLMRLGAAASKLQFRFECG